LEREGAVIRRIRESEDLPGRRVNCLR
jgi:hypothetical protein